MPVFFILPLLIFGDGCKAKLMRMLKKMLEVEGCGR